MDRDGDRRLTITVQPQPSDDGMLKVSEALQQVLDLLRVVEAAGRVVSSDPQRAFDWKLESASTNSPFTVVAVAEARNPSVDIAPYAMHAKRETALALRQIAEYRTAPSWLDQGARNALHSVYQRNLNGISLTQLRVEEDDVIELSRDSATIDAETLRSLAPLAAKMSIPARRMLGEITGHLVQVGRYRGQPALTILSSQYGSVICSVPLALVNKLGGQKTLEDVWTGRSVAVSGVLHYGVGGSLTKVVADDVRDRVAPRVDIEALLDSDFTSGLDPVDYLDQLHGGDLA